MQPPDCHETVGTSLGWFFDVFQVCWALAWANTLFALAVGAWHSGLRQSSFVTYFALQTSLVQLIRSSNPLGMRADAYRANFVLSILNGCSVGWLIFELAFLLLSILQAGLPARPELGASLWQRVATLLPLPRHLQALRGLAHASLWAVIFWSSVADTVLQQAVANLVAGGIMLAFGLLFITIAAAMRRRLLKAQVLSATRVRRIQTSQRLLHMLMVVVVMLVVWFPFLMNTFLPLLTSEDRDQPRYVMKKPCGVPCVLRQSVFALLTLVAMWVVFFFFLLPAGEHKEGKPANALDTESRAAHPRQASPSSHGRRGSTPTSVVHPEQTASSHAVVDP
eukprot:TRINITY_DN4537_c0_g1_i2.p1 TRINITY_DN4537_c0_g1~~TRINITY_DN4537_c0_g1_i2.p1  ORF type:complete len:337 (+),score=67.45 TRINITY_DN4537_c0_g1_i2:81-1091(+)